MRNRTLGISVGVDNSLCLYRMNGAFNYKIISVTYPVDRFLPSRHHQPKQTLAPHRPINHEETAINGHVTHTMNNSRPSSFVTWRTTRGAFFNICSPLR